METKKTVAVEMTEEEMLEYQKMKEERAKKEAAEKRKEDRKSLQTLTDEALNSTKSIVKCLEATVDETRQKVLDIFQPLMDMRRGINQSEDGKNQDSFTFTNKEGTIRVRIGYNMLDNYTSGVDDGIALVTEYLQSLGKDENSKTLINMVLGLLTKDQKGNLKASRVLQLEKIANEQGDEKFIEGMKIIKENYNPIRSSRYIRYEFRSKDTEKWEKADTAI